MSYFLITLTTTVLLTGSMLIHGPREWWLSAFHKPKLFTILFLSFLSVFLGQPRGTEGITQNPIDTIRLVRMGLLGALSCFSIFSIFFQKTHSLSAGFGIRCLVCYAFLAMFSFIYSPIPLLSLWKGYEVLAIALVGIVISDMLKNESDIQHILNILYLALWYLILSALVGAIVNHSEAFPEMQNKGDMAFALNGICPLINANTLSQLAGILAVSAFSWMLKNDRQYRLFGPLLVFIVSLICLLLSHSRTSIIAVSAMILLVLFIYRKMVLFFSLLWFSILLGLGGQITSYLLPYLARGQKKEVFTSLSGRLTFWPEVIEKIFEAPILGHGFYASQRVTWGISSVDNTYLEVLLGLGIIGAAILCLALASIFFNVWKIRPWKTSISPDPNLAFLWIQITTITLIIFIRSLTGPSFQNLHINLVIFTLVMISAHRLSTLSTSLPDKILTPNLRSKNQQHRQLKVGTTSLPIESRKHL